MVRAALIGRDGLVGLMRGSLGPKEPLLAFGCWGLSASHWGLGAGAGMILPLNLDLKGGPLLAFLPLVALGGTVRAAGRFIVGHGR